MIRKMLFLPLMLIATLPAHAQTDRYCIPSEKLTDMHNTVSSMAPLMQQAFHELLEVLMKKNETGNVSDAGCVTQEELAQICKNTWDNNIDQCQEFVYNIASAPQNVAYKTIQVSFNIQQKDFSNINPDIFAQSVNTAVARRRFKSIPSKLQDTGKYFIQYDAEKQINPFIAAAIALYESNRGTSALAREKNNVAGLGGKPWLSFDTVPDCIAKQAETLLNQYNKGYTTLKILAEKGQYTVTNRQGWLRDVSSITHELYRSYNATVGKKK